MMLRMPCRDRFVSMRHTYENTGGVVDFSRVLVH